MTILDQIRKHAIKKPADPLTEAKRRANGEKARELYAAFDDLGGQRVTVSGKRGKIHVSLGLDAAHVNICETVKKIVKTPKGKEIRWKDTGEVIGGWSAWWDGSSYVLKRSGSPEKQFAEQADLEAELAKQVAAVWEES